MACVVLSAVLAVILMAPAGARGTSGSAGASAASRSSEATADPVVNEEAIVAPREVVEGTQQAPAGETPGEPGGGSGPGTGTGSADPPIDPGVAANEPSPAAPPPRVMPGNAAFQTPKARRREARQACRAADRPPTSPMLAVGGSVLVDDDRNWGLLLLVPAAGVAAFALVLTVRRRRSRHDTRTHDPLERIATLVAITGGLAGLVIQFAPGVAVAEHPAREATMTVREVHPRITRGEYARKIGADLRLSKTDALEVGNVIWLELRLRGYKGASPVLQYGLYDENRGEVLLPNTAKEVALSVQDADEQTSFVPVWVGYPTATPFRAQFRLLERGRVQEMTSTGRMRGSAFRYACARA